jgi:orotidine 5'-phosphate decarboxylase subfamily 2
MGFFQKLLIICENKNTHLCIGLDPIKTDFNNIIDAEKFCLKIINETNPYVCCFKPNIAFFEAYGPDGIYLLKKIIIHIHRLNSLVILDCKRGDICSTAKAYATLCFDYLNADCVTLSPFLGYDSIEPFISGKYIDKGVFILCCTSNQSAVDIQDEILISKIAKLSCNDGQWGKQTCSSSLPLGLVIGATKSDICRKVRLINSDSWFLTPGVGAQGASILQLFDSMVDYPEHLHKIVVPISRGISRSSDFAKTSIYYKDEINKAIKETTTIAKI